MEEGCGAEGCAQGPHTTTRPAQAGSEVIPLSPTAQAGLGGEGLTLAIQSLLHPQLQPLLWGQLGLREKGRDRRGCPEFAQPTSTKSLGLGGQLEPRGKQGWDLACLGSPSPE